MENYNITIQTYNDVAQNYEDKFMDMDLYDDTYGLYCSLLKENAKVLDVGCGPGNIPRYFLKKRPDLKITGIDMAPNMIEIARKNNPNAEFFVHNALEIDTLADTFQGVVIGFCMPYLSKEDCKELIQKSADRLDKNGLLYLSTMEDDYSKSGYETTSFSGDKEVYVYYHQEDYMNKCLEESGFKVLKLERKAYPEPDGSFLTDMIFIAEKI